MSVVSKNPFDLLGDDGDSPSPAPAPKSTSTPAAKPASAEPTKARNVPGSAARGGRYPSRGAPRNVFRGEGEPRNTGPTSGDGVAEGMETAGGFDGERVAPSKKHRGGPDAHTKGPRGERPIRNPTSGGHTASGGGASRRGRTPNAGGERRQFERRSGTLPDSQKKVEHGWGSNEGGAELTAEVEGFKDAVAEENVPETPAPEGEDGGWGAAEKTAEAPAAAAEPEQAGEPEEPEEVQKSYDEYLAEKAAQALAFGKKEARQVAAEAVEGTAFVREAIDDFFSGKEKTTTKSKAPKKEKVYIEVDGQFATPAGGRPTRGTGERGGRGGRGGARGGEGRGRGAPRGGRGAPRGGRGGFGGPVVNASDEKAFPALGA